MPVLITCRGCGSQNVTSSRLLPDLCEECVAKSAKRHQQIWENGHGQGTNENSSSNSFERSNGNGSGRSKRADEQPFTRARGVGDAVEAVTRMFGIKPCGSCGQRKAAMNRVDLSGTAREVFLGLAEAIIDPKKVLEKDGSQEINRSEKDREAGGTR